MGENELLLSTETGYTTGIYGVKAKGCVLCIPGSTS
jgi:hypothetical protein